ncbi:MAG: hypothetical protein L0Y72_17580 [Gemmataceae bacterium]|nr:hypothetical protein [Gemmataceae bacterium]MCI0740863.1 hypothetical protein [Gemmataceae bacterium]
MPAFAQLDAPRDAFEFDPHLTGQGEKMNYGPFLSYSLISANRTVVGEGKKAKAVLDYGLRKGLPETIILRSVNVYLGGKYCAAFDTEMCAFPAVWGGGFLNIQGTNLNGYKGETLAHLRLPVIIQNAQTPGWSAGGDFRDPRRSPFGALPKDVVHFKGLYLNGWKTILSYTVGKSKVLELPGMLIRDKSQVFCRTVWIDQLPEERHLFLCDLFGANSIEEQAPGGGAPTIALKRADTTLRVGAVGVNANWKLSGNRLSLVVPPRGLPTAFKIFMARDVSENRFRQIMREAGAIADLPDLCKGGPPRWKDAITVHGKLAADDKPYVVDSIPLPDKNPWNSWMRPGAFDFFKDGRCALCTWNGDVWLVSGLDAKLEKVTWRRFATGLYEPLGLKIVEDVVYVLGRDQITRLHDLNGDGEADFYENFNNDGPTAPSFHSFAMELHTDRAGNFYYARGSHRVKEGTPMHGGVIKVAKDGSKAELICTGFREPNGMSVGPDDTVTIADNQGNNVPTSKIDFVRQGGWYGYPWGLTKPYPEPVLPLCWIPHKEDNSSGGQVWVTSKKWGPFEGDLLHTSYGNSKLFLVFAQRDGPADASCVGYDPAVADAASVGRRIANPSHERFQGGVNGFPLRFASGIMRARFHPVDGQLYLCGLKGWGSNAKSDGSFERVRYTGKPVYMPKALCVKKDAIDITFTQPVDKASLDGVEVEQWTYVWWSDKYGSKDFSIKNPDKVGRDPVTVKRATLSADGKTVSLTIPRLRPVMQMGIYLKNLRAADGTPMAAEIYNTINYIP